ncbi:MAG: FAD-binding oxidoreductase [Verrucomicrobiae bacterium]|nr:FAD-binding oxidoreductase [Verrucomicrobiae bacterium]
MKTEEYPDTAITSRGIRPGSSEYDEARSVWNGMIDKRPAVILRCRDAREVSSAIRYARDQGLKFSVRGNGHNIAGSAVCDEGVVIDLSLMKEIRIDPVTRCADIGPGATLGDVDLATAAHGLALPVGINSTTGISGLTLGGGIGWLSRKYGLTIDNLVGAEVVTADGSVLRASEDENVDLFWALRGGGGNFGIVTSFEFRLHPVAEVFAGVIAFPGEEAAEVYRRYREESVRFPDEMTAWPVLRKAPPLPFLDEADHGRLVLLVPMCYSGDPSEGERFARLIRSFGNPIGEHVGSQPLATWQQAFDPLLTPGARNYWKSHNFTELSDGALDTILDFGHRLPTGECEIFLGQLGGAVTRVSPDATAFRHRDTEWVLNVHCRWREPGDDERCIAWAREFHEASAPFASAGAYSNFLPEDELDRAAHVFGGNHARLAAIKTKYDPDNVFRNHLQIRPASSGS